MASPSQRHEAHNDANQIPIQISSTVRLPGCHRRASSLNVVFLSASLKPLAELPSGKGIALSGIAACLPSLTLINSSHLVHHKSSQLWTSLQGSHFCSSLSRCSLACTALLPVTHRRIDCYCTISVLYRYHYHFSHTRNNAVTLTGLSKSAHDS